MPVSTRSQVSGDRGEAEITTTTGRNPHHGLKEKMRALTQLYGQSKNQMAGSKTPPSPNQPTHHPSVDLVDRNKPWKENKEVKDMTDSVLRENKLLSTPLLSTKKQAELFFPSVTDNEKENQEGYRRDSLSFNTCPKREKAATSVIRKLSLGSLASQSEGKLMKIRRTSGATRSDLEKSEKDSRIMVFVRLRPMGKKEKELGSKSCVSIVEGRDVYLTEFISETDYLRLKRVRGKHFSFDASFPDSTSQQEVYAATTAELVEGVLQGKNGTVFCYGATGAGKTFTMLGTMENPGVMVLAMKDLFSKIRQRSCDGNHVVHLSYLEVYNETVRDLLAPGRPLLLREDKQGITAAGLTQYRAYSTEEVMALLQQGNLNRTTEPTRINETSSRSHAILQVVAEYREKDETGLVSRVGKLSLIDLAGSERAIATDQRTQRSIEGANINRSLLALSSCINALVEGKKHIPYRNSKLTQLLKDSLGGHCNTVMIANISPSSLQFGETQNTLHWADRAKEIKTKGSDVNEELVEIPESEPGQAKLLLELQKENSELRQQVAFLQQKQLSIQAQSMAAKSNLTSPSLSISTKTATPQSTQRRPMHSILAGNCFKTPESKKKGSSNGVVQELQHALKATEVEMEKLKRDHMLQLKKLKKDHAVQIKQKDDFICELLTKKRGSEKTPTNGGGGGVTRTGLRKVASERCGAELERQIKTTPSHRFQSPAAATKKRSFWDSSASKSPSVAAASDGRKMRNHVSREAPPSTPPPPPSMLLQPGFAHR